MINNPIHTPIGKGLHHIAYKILSYLDAKSLCRAELVCNEWYRVIADGLLWKKLIERKVAVDTVWKGLSERRGWDKYLFRHVAPSEGITNQFYRQLYPSIIKDIEVCYTVYVLSVIGGTDVHVYIHIHVHVHILVQCTECH